MSLELLVLKKDWFSVGPGDDRFKYLAALLNKGFDKARIKFGIIKSYRVNNNQSFVKDFSIDKTDEFALVLVLGSKEIFKKFKDEDNYYRDFLKVSQHLRDIYDCDIPNKYLDYFKFDSNDIKVTIADIDYKVNETVIERVISTAGFKKYPQNGNVVEELELTAFTSFLRYSGPKVLDLLIEIFINSKKFPIFTNLPTKEAKIILNAEVIVEHGLVEYYTQKCNFKISEKDTLIVKTGENGLTIDCPFENNIFATMNFSIAFLHREILV